MRKPIIALFLMLKAVSVAALAGAAAPESPRQITADLGQPTIPMSRSYRLCVGAGRAQEGLRAGWQRQLRSCHDALGFEYIRFHGLFTDDMGVCARDAQGRLTFNWQYVDMLYDYLESIGMKPFVELSFMPAALASGDKTVFWWRGNVTPPKNLGEWAELVRQFTRHVTERYGAAEVGTWYFEVWNEPNLKDDFWTGDQEDYFALYRATADAIKGVNAAYRVGGPASAGGAWVKAMIDFCAREKLPLDFISTHFYNVTGALDAFGNKQLQLLPNLHWVADEIQRTREIINHSARPDLELHVTEWSSSYSPRDPAHDDYFSAPYILGQIKRAEGQATSMSYWTFTDIFEETGVPLTPFHGGFGLVNLQGIKKPAFFAFKYLNELGDRELVCNDPSAWVCADGHGGVQVLFWKLAPPFPGGKTLDRPGFAKVRPAPSAGDVVVTLHGLKPGRYQLQLFRTGYQHNDPYTQYLRWGSPANLTRAQETELAAHSADEPEVTTDVEVGANGRFSGKFALRENDVVLAGLTPVSAIKQ